MTITCIGCEKETKYSQPNKSQLLAKGEWFNTTNRINVMSIRKNKIVFIKNSENIQFTPDDVRFYTIVDSFKKTGNRNTFIGQYLITKGNKDSISYQILKRTDSIITLKKDNKNQTFVWKFIARMSEKNTAGNSGNRCTTSSKNRF